jgi:hypothetical protein
MLNYIKFSLNVKDVIISLSKKLLKGVQGPLFVKNLANIFIHWMYCWLVDGQQNETSIIKT